MNHMPLAYLVIHPRIKVMWETGKSEENVQGHRATFTVKVQKSSKTLRITLPFLLRKQENNVRLEVGPPWCGTGDSALD